MGLAEDLLDQANRLVEADTKRPRQVNLRRAISASYYAVFHLLTANAAMRVTPKRRPLGLVSRVQRSFSHQEIRQACSAFNRRPLTDPLLSLLGGPVSDELRAITEVFIELQEERHKADYDTAAYFSRSATLAVLQRAEAVFRNWRAVERSQEASVFLAAIAFGARWSK